jgi:hypothetical protein
LNPQATPTTQFKRHPAVLWLFGAYAIALAIGTHWPKLQAPGPVGTDKAIHIIVFAAWAVLCAACGWFGPPLSWRNLVLSGVVSAAYSMVDELGQAIEWVNRSCEWADMRANLIGVVGASVLLLLLSKPLSALFPRLLPA